MILTEKDKRTVLSVFDQILRWPNQDPHLGSETIREMTGLYRRLLYEDYCRDHGVALCDLTPEDYQNFYDQLHSI